jgi:pimeloyl-ACP methyl ester carboxylesterase
VYKEQFLAYVAFDVRGRLCQIAQPALIVCGAQDRMAPVRCSVYLRDQIVGARLHLIDGAGHMIQIERPQAVARALSDWVEKL